jgi:hypothetical protein
MSKRVVYFSTAAIRRSRGASWSIIAPPFKGGLIEFVLAYATAAVTPPQSNDRGSSPWYKTYADVSEYAVSLRWSFPKGGRLDLVGAGQQSAGYGRTVNSFNWENLYQNLGGQAFFEEMKAQLRDEYDYILVDSRTGVSDTSGICTIQLPDTLPLCGAQREFRSRCGLRRDSEADRSQQSIQIIRDALI